MRNLWLSGAAAFGILGSATVAAQQQVCDRTCLDGVAQRYLQSLVANDPSLVALSPEVRYTEDGMDLEPGDGFWATASALRQHRVNVLDDEWSTAAGLAVMEENSEPVLLAYRLKVGLLG